MSEVVSRVSVLAPGPFAWIGKSINRRLQLAFPPSKFNFRYMPADVTPESWKTLTQGNQPFLGLSFMGWTPNTDSNVAGGISKFMLFVAIRGEGKPEVLYYGDNLADGLMAYAATAAAVLQGFVAGTGAIQVAGINVAIHPAWKDNSAVMALDLRVPTTIMLPDVITRPDGIGIFEELATTWNVPAATGSTDIYTSDWENPNV